MLVKRIEGNHIVWFDQSNHWIQFEEPAWFVFQLSTKGIGSEEIITRCSKKYKSEDKECRQFVLEILANIAKFQSPIHFHLNYCSSEQPEQSILTSYFSIRNYSINNKAITFCFESPFLEQSIHPVFEHFEVSEPPTKSVCFELFKQDGLWGIRVTNDKSKTWLFDQPEIHKGRIFIELLNAIYNKVEEDWMAIVHGSAITDGNSTILFTAACGGGKSTIAALLQTQGLNVISDDMVPVAAKTGKIYPFPAALSVKEGATPILLPLYPELDKTQKFSPASNKQVRYLPIKQSLPLKKQINKAKALIFINFDPFVDNCLEELSKLEAIKLFNTEAWVSSTPENAKRFINWIAKLPCYRLTYSDNHKAIQTIFRILKG